jgi:hypothetical protein
MVLGEHNDGEMVETKNYNISGNPEQMLRALRSALPTGASLSGNSAHGTINVILSGKVVEYTRNGQDLKVTVYKGAGGKSVADIWALIESGLSGFI